MRLYLNALIVLLLSLSLTDVVIGRRFKPVINPKKDKKPEENIPPPMDIDMNKIIGKWYLLSVASRCNYLLRHGTKVEGTIIKLTSGTPMKVSTFTKHNYQCWEIQQQYEVKSPGVFLLKAKLPTKNTDIVVLETDYNTYAILIYKMMNQITMKLYGRTPEIAEATVDKFEAIAQKQKLGLDTVFQFPTYGFCETADKDHMLVMS